MNKYLIIGSPENIYQSLNQIINDPKQEALSKHNVLIIPNYDSLITHNHKYISFNNWPLSIKINPTTQINWSNHTLLILTLSNLIDLLKKNFLNYLKKYSSNPHTIKFNHYQNILVIDSLPKKGYLTISQTSNHTLILTINPSNNQIGGHIGDFGGFSGLGVEHIPTYYSTYSSSLI